MPDEVLSPPATDRVNQSRDLDVRSPWSVTRRRWVSVLLLLHLGAIFVAPLAVVDPASEFSVSLHRTISPYTQSLFLDHGYRFFAPEPGPSHFVIYEIQQADGNLITGRFPDPDNNWPRLLYHRWFMLSETMYQQLSLTLDRAELDEWQKEVDARVQELIREGDPRGAEIVELGFQQDMQDHNRTKQMLDHLADNVGQDLLQRHGGVSIRMKMVTRLIPTPEDIEAGLSLADPRYTPAELQVDLGSQNSADPNVEPIAPLEPLDAGQRPATGEPAAREPAAGEPAAGEPAGKGGQP